MRLFLHRVALFLVLGLLLKVALAWDDEGPPPNECYPEEGSRCYAHYRSSLSGNFDGNYERACKNVTAKSPCHQRIALCPESVRANFSLQEKGYEALRDFVCDRKAFEDYITASRCRDFRKLPTCEVQNGVSPESLEKDPANFGCRYTRTAVVCFDEVFTSDCTMSQKAAKAAFGRGHDILLALEGCSSSAASRLLSQLLLLGVATLTLARYVSN